MCKKYLDKTVDLIIDRPLGSKHPRLDFSYEANYGFVPGTKAPDGGELDAYFLGADKPLKKATGKCIAIIHRLDDDDDKLIVVPDGVNFSDEEIEKQVNFVEKFFKHEILR
jgi:inorganic pyrophosphatase